ncbi:MAG: HAD family hydrolase [Armatimonadota bacterium]|nr:HAD family hydrolase [Armatimonadota bacterium]
MSELYIKQELLKTLPQVDAIVLDIDGVVLNVSQSFRVVITETTQYCATQVMKLRDTGPLLLVSEVELFKLAGGFNSDWDLANAAVALVVAKQAQSGAEETAALRAQPPGWEEYTAELKRRGGGLAAAEASILEMLTPHQRRDFARGWHPKLVTQLFQEMYAGEGACRQLYGFDPEYIHSDGYYQKERVMLDPTLLPAHVKVAVLTGRTRSETQLALQMAGLTERIPETAWVTEGDGVRKPDGRTLLLLRERLEFRYGIYIGDTMDDHRTVLNYRELKGSGRARMLSCIALSGPFGGAHRRLFLEAGVEIVTPDANFLLQYLNTVLP